MVAIGKVTKNNHLGSFCLQHAFYYKCYFWKNPPGGVSSVSPIGDPFFFGIYKPKLIQETDSCFGALYFLVFWVSNNFLWVVWHGQLGWGKLETLLIRQGLFLFSPNFMASFRKTEIMPISVFSCTFTSCWFLPGIL